MTNATPTIDLASRNHRGALLALLLGGAAIGGSPLFVRFSEVGPMATAFWRVALALIPMILFALITRRPAARPPKTMSSYAMLVLPGVLLALDLAAWHISITMTTVANATLLANLAPVFVTLIGFVFFRASVSRTFLIGLTLSIAGLVVLKGGLSALSSGDTAGDGIALIAAAFYACYLLAIGRLRSEFDTLRIMMWSTGAAAVCVLPMALYFEGQILPSSLYGWSIVTGLAFVSHAGGQVAITYALAFLPAAFSSLTLLLQPVVAAILAWVLLGEAIGSMQAIGGLIMLAGILIARRT